MNEQQELTFEQAAMVLGVTRQTVYNWASEGQTPYEVVKARAKKHIEALAEIKQNLAFYGIAIPAASPNEG